MERLFKEGRFSDQRRGEREFRVRRGEKRQIRPPTVSFGFHPRLAALACCLSMGVLGRSGQGQAQCTGRPELHSSFFFFPSL